MGGKEREERRAEKRETETEQMESNCGIVIKC